MKDIVAGLLFIAIALIFGVGSRSYELGAALRMGPAYFPLLASLLLGLLGIAIFLKGLFTTSPPFGRVPVRGAILVLSAPVAFGLVLPSFGFVPAAFLTAALSAAASPRSGLVRVCTIAAGLTVFSYIVFVVLLGVSMPAFGP